MKRYCISCGAELPRDDHAESELAGMPMVTCPHAVPGQVLIGNLDGATTNWIWHEESDG